MSISVANKGVNNKHIPKAGNSSTFVFNDICLLNDRANIFNRNILDGFIQKRLVSYFGKFVQGATVLREIFADHNSFFFATAVREISQQRLLCIKSARLEYLTSDMFRKLIIFIAQKFLEFICANRVRIFKHINFAVIKYRCFFSEPRNLLIFSSAILKLIIIKKFLQIMSHFTCVYR